MDSWVFIGVVILLVLVGGGISGVIAIIQLRKTDQQLRDLKRHINRQNESINKLHTMISELQFQPDHLPAPQHAVDKPVDKPVQKVVESTGDKPVDEHVENVVDKTVDKPQDVDDDHENIPVGILVSSQETKAQPLQAIALSTRTSINMEWIEENIGKRWMTWAGAVILMIATGFFLKYAFDNDWIGPSARVMMGVAFGIVLLVSGDISIRRSMGFLGQGLIGCGLSVMYMSIFAAFSFYQLIGQEIAFVLMILTTASGVTLAILHDAKVIAVLATLGGLLTPVMISTGKANRDGLMGYLVMLDLGVLVVAFFRKWRALDILAFVGTVLLFIVWHEKYYQMKDQFPAIFWLTAFYIIFLLIPFTYHLRKETPIAVERFVMSIANAVFYFGFAYAILKTDHRHVLGFIALGMSASYTAMGALTRQRLASDANSLFGFVTMAVALLTLAVPLHMKMHGVMLMWAVEAPVLIYLGYRFRYLPTRLFGLGVLCIAAARLFISHFPLHSAPYIPVLNKNFAEAIFVAAIFFLSGYIHRRYEKRSTQVDEPIITLLPILGGLLACILFHHEIGAWFRKYYLDVGSRYYSQCSVIFVWMIGSLTFLHLGKFFKNRAAQFAGLLPLAVAVILVLTAYADAPKFESRLFLNFRFIGALFASLALANFAYRFKKMNADENLGAWVFQTVGGAFAVILLVFLSVEVFHFGHTRTTDHQAANWSALLGLSLAWGMYASSMLVIGFWKRVRPLRVAALALFGVTAVKLVLIDMAGLEQLYRIISFFVIGGLMIAAAYLYNKLEKRLEQENKDQR